MKLKSEKTKESEKSKADRLKYIDDLGEMEVRLPHGLLALRPLKEDLEKLVTENRLTLKLQNIIQSLENGQKTQQ